MNNEINGRFKDAPWYKQCENEDILLGGVGGIGSNALYYLAKTIPCNYWIYDMDRVEQHNVGTQFFKKKDIGTDKVFAMYETMNQYGTANIFTFNKKYVEGEGTKPIVISAFDNMKARKDMFNEWKENPRRELFIDGRLRANLYEVYVVIKGREKEYETTLFDDSEADEGDCTFKQTAYFAGLIGARIAHVVVNYLTNKYSDFPYCNLPFKIEEVGDPFFIKLTNSIHENTEQTTEQIADMPIE